MKNFSRIYQDKQKSRCLILQKQLWWGVLLSQCTVLVTGISPSYADTDSFPTVDTLIRRLKQKAEPQCDTQSTQSLEVSPTPDDATILVKKIQLICSSFSESKELNRIIGEVEGSTVTLAELRSIADQITGWYFQQGYITSVATLEASAIKDGIVPIRVIEGSIEEIQLDPPTKRINSRYVRSRLNLGISKPFSQRKLEEQLRLLQTDPLFEKVEASIRPGTKQGQSIVVVRITEANPFDLGFSVDNYSPPSIGSERLGVGVSYRNLTGLGDQLFGSYYFSTRQGGSNVYDFSYQVPLNPMNGTLQLRTAINKVKVIEAPLNAFDIRGQSELYEFTYRQPIVRSLREEFALSLGFSVQNGQTFTFAGPTPFGIGPDEDGNSRTRTIRFAQDYVRRDLQGVWGLRSQFNFGIGAFDATTNSDPNKPDGRFFSWLLQVQRQQRLGADNLLIAQADLQLTPDGLLPSQQFVIGGGQSVRGYRQNVRAGDNGFRFTLEDRITLQRDTSGEEALQLAPFLDLGYIWNVDKNPNLIQRQRFIAGAGLGMLWKPIPNLNLRLDYAIPFVELEDRRNNAQDDGFYFSASYHL
ncbi:ShlB/FhaC/HecB family hemolysin secretion/activation protein [Nostoc sp. FACHB-973]|nr:ShlB/FhaC/HecB family hemolysin secretion/activation protein [Nostoc sp. FACHB-973]